MIGPTFRDYVLGNCTPRRIRAAFCATIVYFHNVVQGQGSHVYANKARYVAEVNSVKLS
jgi:hypothetical protein